MSTVVVTGANRGLGLELVRAFAAAGHRVIGACRDPERATELAAVTPDVHRLDVGDAESIDRFAAGLGDECVDVLVNNAGIDARSLGAGADERDVLALPPALLLETMRVNAVGPLLVVRALLPHLRRSSSPRIVNVSSQVGSMEVGRTLGRDIAYSASKSALNMITVKLAARLEGDGITVIALHPGYLKTDMGGPGASMEPADAATAIASLVDQLTIADTGSFRRWDGSVHPW